MGYGGRQAIRSGDIRRFNFTGNGSNTAFDLGFTPATQNQLIVTVNGLVQHYDAFSISGSTLTFTGTPGSGDAIQVTAVVDAVGVAAIPDGAIANVSTLTVSGNSTFNGSITGPTAFANAVAVTGVLTAAANVNIDSGTLFVDGTNNRVGIGTSSPGYTLQVNRTGNGAAARFTNGSTIIDLWNDSTSSYIGDASAINAIELNTTSNRVTLNTNNNQRLLIDSSGRVTKTFQPAFQAYRDAGHVTYNNVIVFNGVRFNIGSHYSNSTGRFTAPVAGMYQFNTHTMLVNPTGGDHQISFRVNGGNYSTQNPGNGTFNVAFGLSEVIQLAAGDYVDVYYYDSASNSIYGSGGANWTGFSGYLLG